jgi:hypothetical protein
MEKAKMIGIVSPAGGWFLGESAGADCMHFYSLRLQHPATIRIS